MVGAGRWGSPLGFLRRGRDTRAFRGRPMRVLMWNESLTGGGCERNLVELATHFDRDVVEPVVGIYHKDLHYAGDLEKAGVRWFLEEKQGKVDGGFALRLAQRFRKERFDLIHSFMPTPNFWAKLARLPAGRPPLVIFHGTIQPGFKQFLLDRFLRSTVAGVIANSSTAWTECVEKFGFPKERVHLIYNGVDLDRFAPGAADPAVRASLQVPQDAVLLTVVARVREEKNHACLVRALARLHREGRLPANVYGRFVGRRADEALIARLEEQLQEAGLAERFRFSGPRTDVPDVLRASDLHVLPSFFEGCPNSVQEALACGVPVIASAVSDNAKLVRDGENGWLFKSDDDADLADRLHRVFRAGPEGRAKMGAAGRALIGAGYGMDAYVRNTVAVYRQAMELA